MLGVQSKGGHRVLHAGLRTPAKGVFFPSICVPLTQELAGPLPHPTTASRLWCRRRVSAASVSASTGKSFQKRALQRFWEGNSEQRNCHNENYNCEFIL